MKQRELPTIDLPESDRLYWNGAGAVRLETRGPAALALTGMDEGDIGHLYPHPSRVRRIALECGAALDLAEVFGRLSGIRAMALDEKRGAPVPLSVPGVEGRHVHLAPGRLRRSGPTLTLTECGADGKAQPGTSAEVLIPSATLLTLARALRRWGTEALDADGRPMRRGGRR